VDDRTKDERWVDGYSVKVWLFILDEFPECLFGEGLGGWISAEKHKRRSEFTPVLVSTWCFSSLLLTDTGTVLVPVLLGESVRQLNRLAHRRWCTYEEPRLGRP
jgi:hypothetical protein